MHEVPTLHVRNVPQDVYEGLRRYADCFGQSLNAAAVRALGDFVEREGRERDFMQRLEELRAEYLAPDDFPKPEEIIREARDERARRLDELADGL